MRKCQTCGRDMRQIPPGEPPEWIEKYRCAQCLTEVVVALGSVDEVDVNVLLSDEAKVPTE